MIRAKKYFLIVFIIGWYHAYSQSKNDSVFSASFISSVKLTNAGKDKTIFLNETVHSDKPRLFVFLSPECPLCQNYTSVLNRIYEQYSNKVLIYGIIPGRTYGIQTVSSFAQKYKIDFPLLIDESLGFSHYLRATTTPEVILLNSINELIYKGAIDDWLKDIGKARTRVTRNFLQDALDQQLKDEPVTLKRTKAIGCFINDY